MSSMFGRPEPEPSRISKIVFWMMVIGTPLMIAGGAGFLIALFVH